MRYGREGAVGVLMLVLALVSICGALTMAVLGSGNEVDRRSGRELAGVRVQAIAESAIEEAAHRVATGVNLPASPLWALFRAELEKAAAHEIPAAALGALPRTRELAGGEVQLESVTARIERHAPIVAGPRRAYERTGVLAYEATARDGKIVRRVRVEQEFRVALVTMPRPFDRILFFLADARSYLAPVQRLMQIAADAGLAPDGLHMFEAPGVSTRVVLVPGTPGLSLSIAEQLDTDGWVRSAAADIERRARELQKLLEEYHQDSGPASYVPLQELFAEKFEHALPDKVMWSIAPGANERADQAFTRIWTMVDPAREALAGIVRVRVPPGDVLRISDRGVLATWRRGRVVLVVDGDCAVEDVAQRADGLLVVIARGNLSVRGTVTAGLVALGDADLSAQVELTGSLIARRGPRMVSGSIRYDHRLSSGSAESPDDRALMVALSPARERVAADRQASVKNTANVRSSGP